MKRENPFNERTFFKFRAERPITLAPPDWQKLDYVLSYRLGAIWRTNTNDRPCLLQRLVCGAEIRGGMHFLGEAAHSDVVYFLWWAAFIRLTWAPCSIVGHCIAGHHCAER
ncbi:MAG: hypothetical protein R2738_01525 [Bacteroides graminisolvens]